MNRFLKFRSITEARIVARSGIMREQLRCITRAVFVMMLMSIIDVIYLRGGEKSATQECVIYSPRDKANAAELGNAQSVCVCVCIIRTIIEHQVQSRGSS